MVTKLFFLNGTIDNYSISTMKSTIVNFYREDEILSAKQKLSHTIEGMISLCIPSYNKKRIGDNKLCATLDDIISIFTTAESGLREMMPTFRAADLLQVPVITDKMSSLQPSY